MDESTPLVIRRGTPAEADAAAELLYMTFDEFADAALGLDDHTLTLHALAGFYAKPRNRFSYDASWVAEIEGQIAGLLVAFPGQALVPRSLAMFSQCFDVYGFRDTFRLIKRSLLMFTARDAFSNEFYIGHLAVSPHFQRRGIARRLLAVAEEKARAQGLARLSLIRDWGHEAALALYLASGFKIEKSVATPKMEALFHLSGYDRMIKDLTQEVGK